MTKVGVSYFGQHDPAIVKKDLQNIKKHCAWINLPVTEEDVLYRTGNIENTIGQAKDAGLEVWLSPWGVANIFGGEGMSQVPPGAWVGVKPSVDALTSWFSFAESTDADAILYDEVRSPDGGRTALNVVKELMRETDKQRMLYYSGASDWTDELAEEADNIGTDLYWPTDDTNPLMQKIIDMPSHKPRHLWIQGFRVKAEAHHRVRRSLDLAKISGVDYVGIWGYHGSVTMSTLQCESPDLFWAVLGMS